MAKIDKQGRYKRTMHEKLLALGYCIAKGAEMVAAAHLCDLLEWCRQRISINASMQFKDLHAMVGKYGNNPEEIDD